MIYADQFIENNSIFLRNLNKNATSNDWSTASGSYGFYSVPYEQPLAYNHYYYQRFTYKFSTTNQKPTWVQFYRQGGSAGGASSGTVSGGLTANTEYTYSAIVQPVSSEGIPLSGGTIYQGQSNAITGVSGQAKEVIMYDVTELYAILIANNLITKDNTNSLKSWCDNNLIFKEYGINYDITSLITSNIDNKIVIKKGAIIENEVIEVDGMQFYSVSNSLRNNTYFDTGIGFGVYNNSGGGTVTITRVDAKEQNSPFAGQHPYVAKITTTGTASPGAGGFVATHSAGANKIFVEKFVAKIPVGYNVNSAYNSQGEGASVSFLSDRTGTGEWKEYTILYECGSSGSFSTGGHVYISGSNNTSVTWYVAYVNNCDITGKEYLKNFTVLKNNDRIKEGILFSREINECNIFPNGDFSDKSWTLPANWSWDEADYAGNATRSLVQGVNGAAFTLGPKIAIDPTARYKLSYWVKCKGDMTSFLTAIRVYINGTTEVVHGNVNYVSGAKTQLTQALNSGDTVIHLKSVANWTARSVQLGFRSNNSKSWNDKGTAASNTITAIDTTNKTITLQNAYTGAAMPVNTYIVESYAGGTYPYPISKGMLPTDNTWKYVEGYFGSNNIAWGGSGGGWTGLPCETTQIQLYLNIYTNNGTVPIKYSDIRIEQVSPSAGHRYENKIQLKEVN